MSDRRKCNIFLGQDWWRKLRSCDSILVAPEAFGVSLDRNGNRTIWRRMGDERAEVVMYVLELMAEVRVVRGSRWW
jgi:hypothetical protein